MKRSFRKIKAFFLILFFVGTLFCGEIYAGDLLIQANNISGPYSDESDLAEFDDDFDDDEDEEELVVYDPIEPLNRAVFWFNDKFYFFLLKPVAKVYRIVPEPTRISVANFYSNLFTTQRFVNSLLQFKGMGALTELERFVINSTIGVGGFFDPAKKWFHINKVEEDFGQTLGVYGLGPGFYIVLPFFGPSNLRDTVGLAVDSFLDPVPYALPEQHRHLIYAGIISFYVINYTSLDKDTYESIKQQALDPYLFIRNAYTQKRDKAITE